MKVRELEEIKKLLGEIKAVGDKLDYATSTAINQRLIKVNPVINNEIDRLTKQGVDVVSPKILIFTNREAKQEHTTIQDYMNKKLAEIVLDDYKVIDYGKLDEEIEDDNTRTVYFYIKYTG